MLLKDVRIQDYRSVEDSGTVPIEIDVTCLVGKNESGKTAFLQALHLLNPLNPIKNKTQYDEVMDYPSRKSSAYKKTREANPATVVPQSEVGRLPFPGTVLKLTRLVVSPDTGESNCNARV